ncbi:MAG: DUF2330 domain-containing protein [Chitinophagales bacterium]|nr:DUF2330 domain-containing protein [Chitinophagales bacterium]
MKNLLLLTLCVFLSTVRISAFCGFYVAKADSKLFNESSQVILVRDGNKTTLTMSNDFKGDVKDFAMVVPVPVVIKRDDIKIADESLFEALDGYSSPRLVEYYDQDPCPRMMEDDVVYSKDMTESVTLSEVVVTKKSRGVKIEAQYTVGEYDILVLSATDSKGLEKWLIENGYKIPAKAREVLRPYIMSNTKFFVAKVNLEEQQNLGFNKLRPLQIHFESPKFMLPIRLGMANANGNQDLIIYGLSKKGRIECTNYATLNMTSNRKIPEFIKDDFGHFYKDLFAKLWKNKGQKVAFLEYAWDVSPQNGMKCDPCVNPGPQAYHLIQAGADWITDNGGGGGGRGGWNGGGGGGQAYFTRLHVRYNRTAFAQDLMFQETPNRENYQARYILTHPAQSQFDCGAQATTYLKEVIARRQTELANLAQLTGWDISQYRNYIEQYNNLLPEKDKLKRNELLPIVDIDDDGNTNNPNNEPKSEPQSEPLIDTKSNPEVIPNTDTNTNTTWTYLVMALSAVVVALSVVIVQLLKRGKSAFTSSENK